MISATKQFKFEMAHMLSNYDGLCHNVHGHSYILEVTAIPLEIYNQNQDEDDMVVDFSELKEFVNNYVINFLDHAFAYNSNSTDISEQKVVEVLNQYNFKTFAFGGRTTAENMAKYIIDTLSFQTIVDKLNFKISKIRLYETATSWVEVEALA